MCQLSSSKSSFISAYLQESNLPSQERIYQHSDDIHFTHAIGSAKSLPSSSVHLDDTQSASRHTHEHKNALSLDLLSPLSGSMRGFDFEELNAGIQSVDSPEVPHAPLPSQVLSRAASRVESVSPAPHSLNAQRPTLLFAIASDDVAEVEKVLQDGQASPNDDIGTQSALEFALTNDQLVHKTEIVKTLLAYGADPSVLPPGLHNAGDTTDRQDSSEQTKGDQNGALSKKRDSMNPAMKYYLARASSPQATQTSAAIQKSVYRPLTRIRFDFVGQDRALEHLYRVLSMHSQQPIASPLVVLCCGPSGHGKSLLARKCKLLVTGNFNDY